MPRTTPRFGIHYPVDGDPVYQLPTILSTMASDTEYALTHFDYEGADPNTVLSRVASLETRMTAAESKLPSVSSYSRTASFAAPANGATVTSFAADFVGTGISYDGTKWTLSKDCVVTVSLVAAKSRISTWASDQRQWIELVKNSVGANPPRSQELVRTQFANEDLASSAYSGKFKAGDYLSVYCYHNFQGAQTFGPFGIVFNVQAM